MTLRGKIFDKYASVEQFAKDVGWSASKARRIVRGDQVPDTDDIVVITEHLHLSESEFYEIFFPDLSTLWTDATIR